MMKNLLSAIPRKTSLCFQDAFPRLFMRLETMPVHIRQATCRHDWPQAKTQGMTDGRLPAAYIAVCRKCGKTRILSPDKAGTHAIMTRNPC